MSVSRYDGHYKGSGQVIRDTVYSIAIRDGNEVHVFFKGTGSSETRKGQIHEWWEDGEATIGMRVTAWDKELQFYIDNYGYQSDKVTYTGYSRGGALARYMGGIGYGSATWNQYPPREGSQSVYAGYTMNAWDAFNAWAHNSFVIPVSNAIAKIQHDVDPIIGHHVQGPVSSIPAKRGRHDMHAIDAAHEPKRQKTTPLAPQTGDFAGLVTTFYYPTSGRIIAYKGIPRKRKFSALNRYSPFWKEQNRLSADSVMIPASQA